MAISFVGSATFASSSHSSSFTLNKPSGVTDGDLMLGYLSFYPGSGVTPVTPPSGWTKVRDVTVNHQYPHQLCVMQRVATSSEPGSWTGSLDSSESPKASVTVAYRGAGGILTEGGSSAGTTTSYSTATVNNTLSSGAWRVTAAGYESTTADFNITANDTFRNGDEATISGPFAIQIGAWDSNGSISFGNTSRTISRSVQWDSSTSWIGILQGGSSGVLDIDVVKPTMTMEGIHSNDATFALTVPFPTMEMTGIAIQDVGGPMEVVVPVAMEVTVIQPVVGTMDIHGTDTVTMNIVTETEARGPRVSKVESESRTYYAIRE